MILNSIVALFQSFFDCSFVPLMVFSGYPLSWIPISLNNLNMVSFVILAVCCWAGRWLFPVFLSLWLCQLVQSMDGWPAGQLRMSYFRRTCCFCCCCCCYGCVQMKINGSWNKKIRTQYLIKKKKNTNHLQSQSQCWAKEISDNLTKLCQPDNNNIKRIRTKKDSQQKVCQLGLILVGYWI